MKSTQRMIILIALSILLMGCQAQADEQQELYILTAASLTDVMKELETIYEAKHPGVNVQLSFASSGQLKQQILQGVPADLFFSAAEDEMRELEEKGIVDSSIPLLQNELVLVTHKNSTVPIERFSDLIQKDVVFLSIGQPESVPAGRYAKQVFEAEQIWNEVESKIVYARDVRQVLSYIETENVEAGIVYKTDALTADQVRIVISADPDNYDKIIYPVGLIKESKHKEQARQMMTWFQSDEARQIFAKYGFKMTQQ